MSAQMFVVEARDENDALVTDRAKRPPFAVASESQLFEYYSDNANPCPCSWAAMEQWYQSKGWSIRRKEW